MTLAEFKLEASQRRRDELEKEYYFFLERSGHGNHPMEAVLHNVACNSRFLDFLRCLAAGESVGEDDDEPEITFADEKPPGTPNTDGEEDEGEPERRDAGLQYYQQFRRIHQYEKKNGLVEEEKKEESTSKHHDHPDDEPIEDREMRKVFWDALNNNR